MGFCLIWIFVLYSSICMAQDMSSQYAFNQFYQPMQSQYPNIQSMQVAQPNIQPSIQSFNPTIPRTNPVQAMPSPMQALQPPIQPIQPLQPNYYPQPQQPILRYQHDSLRSSKRHHHHHHRDSSDYDSFEDYDCGFCSCETCMMNPKPCCQQVCDSCLSYQPPKQDGVVLVPYPYPVILRHTDNSSNANEDEKDKGKDKGKGDKGKGQKEALEKLTQKKEREHHPDTDSDGENTASTTTTTTPEPTTQKKTDKFIIQVDSEVTTKPSRHSTAISSDLPKDIESDDWSMPEETTSSIHHPPKTKFGGHSSANLNVLDDLLFKKNKKFGISRRTQLGYEPKYGIVPIPDELALNLMEQLRNIKLIQARRHASKFISNSRRAVNALSNIV